MLGTDLPNCEPPALRLLLRRKSQVIAATTLMPNDEYLGTACAFKPSGESRSTLPCRRGKQLMTPRAKVRRAAQVYEACDSKKLELLKIRSFSAYITRLL